MKNKNDSKRGEKTMCKKKIPPDLRAILSSPAHCQTFATIPSYILFYRRFCTNLAKSFYASIFLQVVSQQPFDFPGILCNVCPVIQAVYLPVLTDKWKKKICVVVGGAKGRGSNLVEEYAGRRYYIAFMDTDKERGKLLKEKMEKEYGRKVFFFHGDAGSEEDLELFAGAVIAAQVCCSDCG